MSSPPMAPRMRGVLKIERMFSRVSYLGPKKSLKPLPQAQGAQLHSGHVAFSCLAGRLTLFPVDLAFLVAIYLLDYYLYYTE